MGLKNFSIPEAFCGKDGSTSISLVCGFVVVITGCTGFGTSGLCYLLMTLFVSKHEYDPTVISGLQTLMLQSVIVLTIGAAFLGIRRFTTDQELHDTAKDQIDGKV